jgi:hypothetical protein
LQGTNGRGRSETVTEVEISDAPPEEEEEEPQYIEQPEDSDAIFTGTYVPPVDLEEVEPTILFCVPLTEVLARKSEANSGIPAVVKQMVQYIANEGLWTRDIFKLPRPKKSLEPIIEQIDKGENINWYNHTPTVVGDLLKQYLTDLPEPVLTYQLFPQFVQAASKYLQLLLSDINLSFSFTFGKTQG